MSKVTVIIPCYNTHQYLPLALDSLAKQTCQDFKIIIINDGSTNQETINYLAQLPSNIKVIHQTNKGLAAARNTGFKAADSEYVLPLDCDDYLAPDFVAKMLARIESAKSKKVFSFSHIHVFGDRQAILPKRYNLFQQLFTNQLPYCLLLPKVLWAEVGGYDEAMRLGFEDWDFNIRLGLSGAQGLEIAEPLFYYRTSSQGMLYSLSHKHYAQLWAYIQRKHPSVYKITALLKRRKQWVEQPCVYSSSLLLGWYLFHRLTPNTLVNFVFSKLMRFSQVHRLAKN
ncbi:MAG: glycosyltransferase family A protein [Gammaproteobacteria bacterium]